MAAPVDTTVISGDAVDSKEPKFSVAKIKGYIKGVNHTIYENLPPQLKQKIPPNAPVLQGNTSISDL